MFLFLIPSLLYQTFTAMWSFWSKIADTFKINSCIAELQYKFKCLRINKMYAGKDLFDVAAIAGEVNIVFHTFWLF